MNVLVTGATGLVGNNVVRMLLERGIAVRVLARNPQCRSLAGLSVEVVPGDLADLSAIEQAVRGATHVVHAAGRVHIGWTGWDEARAVNVEGTRRVAQACRREGARLVHVSTVNTLAPGTREHPADEEAGPPQTVECAYVVTKQAAEQVVLDEVASGLEASIVLPVYMLGPWDWKPSSGRMLLHLAGGWSWMAPPGGLDFCDVRDVTAGILTALERGQRGRKYILGGEAHDLFEAWSLLAPLVGGRKPVRKMRWPALWLASRYGDMLTRLRRTEPDVNGAAVRMSTLQHHYSYARAARELDYRPRPMLAAAAAAWQWFLDYGYVPQHTRGASPQPIAPPNAPAPRAYSLAGADYGSPKS